MPADRFFLYAERLLCYGGALQARARAEMAAADSSESPAPQQRSASRSNGRPAFVRENDTVEYADDGTMILNGVAVDAADGIPLWVKRRPIMSQSAGGVEVIPGDIASLGFSAAMQGQFSYSQVKKEG